MIKTAKMQGNVMVSPRLGSCSGEEGVGASAAFVLMPPPLPQATTEGQLASMPDTTLVHPDTLLGLGGGEEEERFRSWFQVDPLLLFWGETLSLEAWKGL